MVTGVMAALVSVRTGWPLALKKRTRPVFRSTSAEAWPALRTTDFLPLTALALTEKAPGFGLATAISDGICSRAGSSTATTWMMDGLMTSRRTSFADPVSGWTTTPVAVLSNVPAMAAPAPSISARADTETRASLPIIFTPFVSLALFISYRSTAGP